MGRFYTNELEEVIKKSDFYIQSEKDYEELQSPGQQFLDCCFVEEKETIIICYDIDGKMPFSKLRDEKRIDCFRALLEVKRLAESFEEYKFVISPENLYYDRNFRIYIKRRELYEPGISGELADMTEQYRALVAYILQNRYEFDDYYLGGSDLYKKNNHLKKLALREDCEAIAEWLEEAYKREWDNVFLKRVEVNKAWYRMNVWYMVITIAIIITAGIYIVYAAGELLPRKNAMIQAQNSFLDGKYVQVIDDLKDVDMKYMDKYLKYILAVSYVKGESLTPEQKENVLATITVDGEEKLKDYWIYLGRLNTAEAQNIAMQRGDDELLLYAYMLEKTVLEKNSDISGEEKTTQLDALEKKIEELAKQYEPEETE